MWLPFKNNFPAEQWVQGRKNEITKLLEFQFGIYFSMHEIGRHKIQNAFKTSVNTDTHTFTHVHTEIGIRIFSAAWGCKGNNLKYPISINKEMVTKDN